jgi:pimeloyl-ACP methyl ester carboxylesterase
MSIVSLAGYGEVTYHAVGQTPDQALLFIHGWGGSSHYWLPAMNDFAMDYACFAPDLPGFGGSKPISLPVHSDEATVSELMKQYSHRGLAKIILAFMDAAGIDRCSVIGHSFGSGVAVAMAAMCPERIERVVVSNFSTFRDERERKMIVLMHSLSGQLLKLRNMPFAKSDGFAKFLGRRFFHHVPDDMALLRAGLDDFWAMDPHAAEMTVKGSLGWETPEDLKRLQAPLLLIHSQQDQIMPARNAEYTASLAPHGQLAWINDCGHFPMIEKRPEFVRTVRDFLSDE